MAPPAAYGDPVALTPLVRRVLAPNPSVFTGPGTNTYLVGYDRVAVIDPGPDLSTHLDAVAAAGRGRIRWILVTHTHPDHAPAAAGLAGRTGARVMGFDARDGFAPDTPVGEGWHLRTDEFRLAALHTPGHASNHLCYLLEEEALLFSGDHIMSGSTVVIRPPDGDMAVYMDGLRRLQGLAGVRSIAPGHGSLITDPGAKLTEYLTHRSAREALVYEALRDAGRGTVEELVPIVYLDVPEDRHPIAKWSLWAHLRKLAGEGRVTCSDPDDVAAAWSVVAA